MPIHKKPRRVLAVLGLLMAVGCAGNQATQTDETAAKDAAAATPAGQSAKPADTAPTHASVQIKPRPQIEIVNPTMIVFDKMSVALDAKSRETIAQIAEKARTSGKISVTGFCDRNQIKNAQDSAVARAVTTRDELIVHGVAPANITVKFSTSVPKRHAAVIKFEELELTRKK